MPQAVDTQSPVSTSDAQDPPTSSISTVTLPACCPVDAQPIFASRPRSEPAHIPTAGELRPAGTGSWPSSPPEDTAPRPRIVACPAGLPAPTPSSASVSASISQSTAGLDQHPTPQNQSAARRPRHISLVSPTRTSTSTVVPCAHQSSCRHVFRQCLGLGFGPGPGLRLESACAAPERGLSKACHRALSHEQQEI